MKKIFTFILFFIPFLLFSENIKIEKDLRGIYHSIGYTDSDNGEELKSVNNLFSILIIGNNITLFINPTEPDGVSQVCSYQYNNADKLFEAIKPDGSILFWFYFYTIDKDPSRYVTTILNTLSDNGNPISTTYKQTIIEEEG